MFKEAPISPASRELIAAYTSSLNRCDFCMNAHAAVAADLYQDKELVWSVLRDMESSPLVQKDKALLRFVRKLTLDPGSITQEDTDVLKAEGWNDASIYYAIGACSLFNFYNRFVLGNGVKLVSEEAFERLGARMAKVGYSREAPPQRSKNLSLMREASPSVTNNESTLGYPGWSVATAAFVGVMTSFSPIVPYTFSLFLNPLHAAFGWKREAMDGTFATAAITVALISPFLGMLLDRFPPRRIILPSIIIFALALAPLSRLRGGIGQFYLTFFVLGLVANGTAQFAYTRTILTWFQRHRGFALALILTGSGVGSILIPPATQWMIGHHGWRNAYLLLGGIALLGFPLTAFLVRNRPAAFAQQDEAAVSGVTVGKAFASAAFWVLCGITILSAFSENGLVTNLAAILSDHGLTAQSAAFALSIRGGAGILGRLCVGFLIDHFSPQRIQTMILILAASGTLVLAFASSSSIALFGATLLGIGLGSEADVLPYLLAHYFGRKHFSVLYGLTWTAYALGGATGPMFIGHLYDGAGTYQSRFIVYLALVAFAAVLVSLLLRRKQDADPALTPNVLAASPISMEE